MPCLIQPDNFHCKLTLFIPHYSLFYRWNSTCITKVYILNLNNFIIHILYVQQALWCTCTHFASFFQNFEFQLENAYICFIWSVQVSQWHQAEPSTLSPGTDTGKHLIGFWSNWINYNNVSCNYLLNSFLLLSASVKIRYVCCVS